MTTKDFIKQAFYGNTKMQKCSSVFRDGDNNIYSYGYHYPLLFRVNGKVILNDRGYSSTTGRHIMWANQAVNYTAIKVHTLSTFRLTGDDDAVMAELIRGQITMG